MAKVYVPQETLRYDSLSGVLVPVHDITAAGAFGELVRLVKPGTTPTSMSEITELLDEKMADYSPDDFVLGIGDLAIIAATVLVAAKYNNGSVTLLRFDRRDGRYHPLYLTAGAYNGNY